MAQFLREEHGVDVNQSTISRLLKRAKWTRKRARRIAKRMDFSLRNDYLASIAGIRAHQMVFLDESLFNETTGWRLTAWAPIGQAARYSGSRRRGRNWSLLAAYSIKDYLSNYVVKEGYFNTEEFR